MGLLLSLIGLKTAGIVVANPDTMVSLGNLDTVNVALVVASLALIATLVHHKVRPRSGSLT
jgi:AGZA family xanthine/uracil permease-like MFS transporter